MHCSSARASFLVENQQLHCCRKTSSCVAFVKFSRCTVYQQMHSIVIVQQLLYSFLSTVHFSCVFLTTDRCANDVVSLSHKISEGSLVILSVIHFNDIVSFNTIVLVRQLMEEQQVKLETSSWVVVFIKGPM
ncbi:thyroid adenoma-associated protein [Dorcoceras hygrometricum]|uniref:Thyroid adenoma-associated protein n=1 Tax=Dorcoceras hygrometricum TaxID=472368 RepID=A0A2Z7D827_9LAMI|nr:thyroid adenoma-associated protein [Dorcoceras hygrometricum]